MAQFSVIVPDDLGELINEISKQTGRSISSLCADYLQEGAYRHVEQLNKVEVWRSQLTERQRTKEKNTTGDINTREQPITPTPVRSHDEKAKD